MTIGIEWSADALEDRDQLFDHIEANNPRAAITADDLIDVAADRLLQFPQSGRPGREPDTRELLVSGTSYIAVYRLERDVVHVLRVLHGAQQWPPE